MHVPRIQAPGAFFHVGTRGNNKRSIFADDTDRIAFLAILARVIAKYDWTLYAYCLMGNHYHLVVRVGDDGISKPMCALNGSYALTFNGRHERVNHLFGRRFWSELITTDRYLVAATRYVVQNPIRAGLCRACEDWPWSSYRATIGEATAAVPLDREWLLGVVAPGSSDPAASFRDFCHGIVPRRPRSSGQVWRQPHAA